MDLIALNIWGGKRASSLLDWFRARSTTDIICLQEVFSHSQSPTPDYYPGDCADIHEQILNVLSDHKGIFCPLIPQGYGLSMYVHTSFTIIDYGHHWTFVNDNYQGDGICQSRCLQWVSVAYNNDRFTIFNLHGIVNKQGKLDCKERFDQLTNIQNFMRTFDHPVILAGDFNVTLDTQFIQSFDQTHTNLVKKYNALSTRSSVYTGKDRYADYIFLPNGMVDHQFSVCPEEVSDHYPLYCDFSLS